MKQRMGIWFCLALFLAVMGCTTYRGTNNNFSYLYDKRAFTLHPEFMVYHESPDSSQLYFKINTGELLYVRESKAKPFSAAVKISYQIYSSIDSDALIDSSSTVVIDTDNQQVQKNLIGKVSIPLKSKAEYTVQIKAVDINRQQTSVAYVNVDKTTPNSRQNFLVKDRESGLPLFNNVLNNQQGPVLIETNKPGTKVFGRYYNREFPLAAPPFSTQNSKPFNYEADSLFEVQNPIGSIELEVPYQGFVHLQLDTSNKEGLTLFSFSGEYPKINRIETMLPPMRYLTSEKEYSGITSEEDMKKALDEFWLDRAGSKERAREVIRSFYNRVQDANTYFTSYLEGWKTDRGLIYIIYGTPNAIYKTKTNETWVYGEENNMMSITFNFRKVKNPFTDNDYALSRNQIYKSNWYRAVESWRQGRVFSTN